MHLRGGWGSGVFQHLVAVDTVAGRDSETSQMAGRIGRALTIFIVN